MQRVPSKWINEAYCNYSYTMNGKKIEFEDQITIAVFKHGQIDIYMNPINDERYSNFNPFSMSLEDLHLLPDALNLIRKVKRFG